MTSNYVAMIHLALIMWLAHDTDSYSVPYVCIYTCVKYVTEKAIYECDHQFFNLHML